MKFDSLRVEKAIVSPRAIVIIDDVITTGASVIAAASRLREAFPDSTIRALAIVRTMSPGEVDPIRAPCLGRVSLDGPRAVRRP